MPLSSSFGNQFATAPEVFPQASRTRDVGTTSDPSGAIIPCVRLFTETVYSEHPDTGDLVEHDAPLIQLSFEYSALRSRVRASDPKARFFVASSGGVRAEPRDFAFEAQARQVLERFGAVDLDCLVDMSVAPDVDADYLVRVEGDVHQHCGFTSRAVPAMEALGWKVEVDRAYPFQVVNSAPEWYANVREDSDRPDWFALELGVEVGGARVDLLPALLDLLQDGREGGSLGELQGRREIALPVSETHHIAVEGEHLRSLLRVVIELYEGAGELLRFPKHCAVALEGLDEAFALSGETLSWNDSAGAREHARVLSAKPAPVVEPVELEATLRPYQRQGLAWLQHLRAHDVGGILADDMGLGKTLQTIAHIATEVAEGRGEEPTLVVAPTSLMGNWARELRKFAPHLRVVAYHGPKRAERRAKIAKAHVVLTSYPILVRDEEELTAQHWHQVVLDEAHTIKNPRSRTHLAAKAIDADHRLCLTGTPVENHLGELFALFDFLNPGMLGSAAHFRAWYRQPIEKYGDTERLMALHEQVTPFIMRRLKSEVATELPPKTELLRPIELGGKQRELYEAIRIAAHTKVRSVIRKKGLAASTIAILDALMKLRQLCCDPRLVRMDAARFVRESAKREALFELLEQQLPQGHRVLIFSQFTSMLSLISEGLRERGVRHLTLTGATKDRQGLCDRFEAGEADVFLISLKAGGTGLNLTSADTVIHYDPWWNPQAQAQATDRAYRIGQKKPVFVYSLYIAGSVEESMLRLQRKKRRLADAILAGELPADAGLQPEDVESLLAPL